MRSSSRYLILLLGLTLVLSGMLAYEAQRATRSHQVTADRALRDYAAVAAWELVTASEEQIDHLLAAALGPVTGTPAVSPYDSLPPPSALAGGADSILRCDTADPSQRYFSLDLRTGTLAATSAGREGLAAVWLRDSLLERSRRGFSRDAQYGVLWKAATDEVALYGIKSLRYSGYAVPDAPLAAYGLVTCPAALSTVFADVLARHPLLPRSVTGGLANSDLASVQVSDPAEHVIFRAGPPAGAGAFGGDAASDAYAVRVWLPAEVAGRLVVSRPASRLPILIVLLALTAGLGAVGVRQLRREEELVRIRADFTSSVSHELRTPLTQILLFAETLELGRAEGEDARREAVDIIVQEARRLAHLVENVLHFSRTERQVLRVKKELTRLAPLVREIVERFAPLAGTAALRIRMELDERVAAPVDAEGIHQIVINLLDNAVKHAGRDGPITVRLSLHSDRARIVVEDTGLGIPAADRQRVWDPFVRLRPSDGITGSGIGLAVVRQLATAHGGSTEIDEVAGGGSRFVVELPGGIPTAPAAEDDARHVPEASWPES